MTVQTSTEETPLEARFEPQYISERILNLLTIYPKISPTMLSVAMGPQIPASYWRPVYNDLVEEGKVQVDTEQSTSAAGRVMQHTIISLRGS